MRVHKTARGLTLNPFTPPLMAPFTARVNPRPRRILHVSFSMRQVGGAIVGFLTNWIALKLHEQSEFTYGAYLVAAGNL